MEKNDSVEMPLQQTILSHLEISPESKATGTCNTIVKVPTVSGFKLVGQNTESECLAQGSKNNNQTPKFNSPRRS